ncbi:unnamed protein product [Urochloa humidicola]
MTSLRTLGYFDLSRNSLENVQSLSMLTNLRDLQLTCSTVQPENLNSKLQLLLNSILGRLSSLKSLTLVPRASSYAKSINEADATGMAISGGFSSLSSAPALLQSLEVSPRICIFLNTPKWFGQLCKLCVLKFGIRKIDKDGLDVLRGLPDLAVLSVYVQTKPAERIVIGKIGFLVIKYFKFKCCDPWLEFDEGAMPNLRKLKLAFNECNADQKSTTPVGIKYLSELKEVSAKIGSAGLEESHRRAAKSAFIDAIDVDPRFQRVNVQFVKQIIGTDDQSSVTPMDGDSPALALRWNRDDGIPREQRKSSPSPCDAITPMAKFRRCILVITTCRYLRAIKDPSPICARVPSSGRGVLSERAAVVVNELIETRERAERLRASLLQLDDQREASVEGLLDGMLDSLTRAMSALDGSGAAAGGRSACHEAAGSGSGGARPQRSVGSSGNAKKRSFSRRSQRTPSGARSQRTPSDRKITATLEDGHVWRKYGQKAIPNSPHPRSYYRCIHRPDQGCSATRQVQTCEADPSKFDVSYYGEHTCSSVSSTIPHVIPDAGAAHQFSTSWCTSADVFSSSAGSFMQMDELIGAGADLAEVTSTTVGLAALTRGGGGGGGGTASFPTSPSGPGSFGDDDDDLFRMDP